MKKFTKIILIVVASVLALGFLKDGIVQVTLETAISKFLPVSVHVGRTRASFIKSTIELKAVKVSNVHGFPEKLLADIPFIFIQYEPGGLAKHMAHFQKIQLDLKELTVVKNKEGKLNVEAFKSPKQDAKASSKQSSATLKIDTLVLSIGRVVYKDYSGLGQPSTQTFEIQMKDRTYHNINNPTVIASLVMTEVISRSALSRITNLDISFFKDQAGGLLSDAVDLSQVGVGKVGDTAKNILKLFN